MHTKCAFPLGSSLFCYLASWLGLPLFIQQLLAFWQTQACYAKHSLRNGCSILLAESSDFCLSVSYRFSLTWCEGHLALLTFPWPYNLCYLATRPWPRPWPQPQRTLGEGKTILTSGSEGLILIGCLFWCMQWFQTSRFIKTHNEPGAADEKMAEKAARGSHGWPEPPRGRFKMGVSSVFLRGQCWVKLPEPSNFDLDHLLIDSQGHSFLTVLFS